MEDNKAMVIFQPSGRRGEVRRGINIIEASRLLGVDIEALCGEKKVCGKCVVRIEKGHFDLSWPGRKSQVSAKISVITQKDVRQIQLAKGALYAGCKLMMKRMDIEKVDKVKIAGAFGTHVARTKAPIMGLFPDCKVENIFGVGNAAGCPDSF